MILQVLSALKLSLMIFSPILLILAVAFIFEYLRNRE